MALIVLKQRTNFEQWNERTNAFNTLSVSKVTLNARFHRRKFDFPQMTKFKQLLNVSFHYLLFSFDSSFGNVSLSNYLLCFRFKSYYMETRVLNLPI